MEWLNNMNTEQRLNLISKIALHTLKRSEAVYELLDLLWIIGMISDSTLSEQELIKEIEDVRERFPEYKDLLTY